MNIEHLINKFEHYAKKLKEIKHDPSQRMTRAFLHLDYEDLQSAITAGLKFPAILLQTPEANKEGLYDNPSEGLSFTFIVLNSSKKKTKLELIAEAKAISDKIFNRLCIDVQTDEEIYSVVGGTDEGVFGPMGGNIHGWAVSIVLESAFDGEVKAEDWEDMV